MPPAIQAPRRVGASCVAAARSANMLFPRPPAPHRSLLRPRLRWMLGLLIMWVAIGIVWRILISAPVQATKWDAIIVPGGGLEEDGRPYDFVRARLDAALLHDAETEAYIVLSRGTTHKPPPRNAQRGRHDVPQDRVGVDHAVIRCEYRDF